MKPHGILCSRAPLFPPHHYLAVVALLVLTPATASAEPSAEALSLTCNGCHGPDGISYGDGIPSIAGQDARYLFLTLKRFQEGERKATIMDRIAKGYQIYQLRKIADYFAAKPWGGPPAGVGEELVAKGEALHRERCEECHEDLGRYRDKDIPRLAGQGATYLYQQLGDYVRNDDLMPQPAKMAEHLDNLSDRDLAALSAFYSRVK